MLPGIAAHCDPSFRGDLASEMSRSSLEMQMSSRAAKIVSAVFASLLVGSPLSTLSSSTARAAEDCLAGPKKDQTPEGSHWYYRIDHANKRNCWYLGEEREKLSQTTAPKRSQSAPPVSPEADRTMQPSIADAHAELPPQPRIDAPSRDNAFTAAMPAQPAIRQDSDISGIETARSIIASRWPDSSMASPSNDPAPNKREVVAAANSVPQSEPAIQAAGPLVAADASSQTSTYSAPMQLAAALMAALALAGIVASLILSFRRARRPAKPKIRQRRGASFEATDDDSILLSAEPGADVVPRRRGFARDLDRDGDRSERIAEFFSQLSKRN
jgi:hypothetical protein